MEAFKRDEGKAVWRAEAIILVLRAGVGAYQDRASMVGIAIVGTPAHNRSNLSRCFMLSS